MTIEVPQGSIYIWMYTMGLKHVPIDELSKMIRDAGKDIREKDIQNYWNGFYRSDLYLGGDGSRDITLLRPPRKTPTSQFLVTPWEEYPEHPYAGLPEIDCRWIPCNSLNKPMIRWKDRAMYREQAERFFGMRYLAENLKGTQMIVVDIDGDHGDVLDMDAVDSMWEFHSLTHALDKPKMVCEYDGGDVTDFRPASYHLTFRVDRVVPTMHFPDAGIDIIGNRVNSLRYLKDKVHNGCEPLTMDATIWARLQDYVRQRKETKCSSSRRGLR